MEASQPGGTTHPSPDAPAIRFDAAWPAISDRVTAVLRSRGVQAADVDDIVQEVAIRALRQLDRFTSDEHMVRWCCRVAINAHIDVVRRGRRLSGEPVAETAAALNVAETVEGRLALDAALVQVAGLSAEDRALLLDPPTPDTRKEAVRLAVRRHRLRARIAAALEGVLAGVPWLRRVAHSDSLPVRATMAAVPVVAVLSVLPLVTGTWSSGRSHADRRTENTARQSRSTSIGGTTPASGAASATRELRQIDDATSPASSRTIIEVHGAGTTVGARQDTVPDDDAKTICLSGYVNLCVDRPGPTIPLPPLPLPAVPSHGS